MGRVDELMVNRKDLSIFFFNKIVTFFDGWEYRKRIVLELIKNLFRYLLF